MNQEFEGRTEKEAIETAIEALGLERDEFDVEILETEKGGIFNLQKKVRIRVHLNQDIVTAGNEDPENDLEHAVVDFVRNMTEKMGYPSEVKVKFREAGKIGLRLDTPHSNILIGKKGKNLDAIQLLANVIAGRLDDGGTRVVVDAENYRQRREESLIRLAQQVGDQVMQSHKSKLLEPMNPFERRLIHTTLNDVAGITTKSEGEGLYKQVRVIYRGFEG
ncbi:MAG TPA: RNA-binding cell elongation regulator Jag/EloR [Spirochaetia bacterium]|nr:RNA-binding cell elongation regulator Jag/EloR [Spirochaetia bacterium]